MTSIRIFTYIETMRKNHRRKKTPRKVSTRWAAEVRKAEARIREGVTNLVDELVKTNPTVTNRTAARRLKERMHGEL